MACPKPASSLHPRAPPANVSASRSLATKLLLWASEGNAASLWPVRSLPLLFTHGPRPQTFLQAAAWPTKLLLWASEGNAASLWPVRSLPLLFTHGPRPQTFLQAAAWPTKLLLWASEGNAASLWPVRSLPLLFTTGPARKRFCRPQLGPQSFFYGLPKATLDTHGPRPQSKGFVACPNPASSLHPRAPARKRFCRPQLGPQSFFYGLPKATRPLCGLSEACLFSSPTGPARKRFCRPQLGPQSFFYGLPKATLDTHGPGPQTLLGSRQACPGLSVACPKPVRSLPLRLFGVK